MIFLELRARFAVLSFPSRKGKFDEKKADSEGSLGRMERNQTLVFPRGMEKVTFYMNEGRCQMCPYILVNNRSLS